MPDARGGNARTQPAIYRLVARIAVHLQLLVVATVLVGSGCAVQVPGESEAALVLEDILARAGPSRLKSRTLQPSRTRVTYAGQGNSYAADLYQSSGAARAGIVLVPGLARDGKDDTRLVAFAYTLARADFMVLVPDIASLRNYEVHPSNVRAVADAFSYLLSRLDGSVQRSGIMGFSYAAGPVLLSALQPDIRGRVAFVVTVGGYYDLREVAVFAATGYFRDGASAAWQHAAPHPYAQRLLSLHVGRVPSTTDPEKARAAVADMPAPQRAAMAALNPAEHDLSGVHASFILLHGRSDDFIPYTESVALARALASAQARVFLLDGLAHVDMRPQIKDIPGMLDAVAAFLSQRTHR